MSVASDQHFLAPYNVCRLRSLFPSADQQNRIISHAVKFAPKASGP